jgi:hypothetical protein
MFGIRIVIFPKGGGVMQKLFNFLMVGLAFTVLNVATVAAQTDIPAADTSAAPIGEGGEAGGPAATDMGGNMINDGGHGANSAAEAEAGKKAAAIAKCLSIPASAGNTELCEKDWELYTNIP